jgi:hypothetical protein
MSAVGEPARERPALRVALVAGDPIRHQGLMAIIRGGGHAVVEHHGEADVVLVDGESIDQYGAPAVTLGRADCGQAGALPADATAVQIDAALLAAAAGLIVRVPSLPSPSFEALDDSEAPLLTRRETDVLAAIADGLSNKAAARRLCSGTGCGACLAFQSR